MKYEVLEHRADLKIRAFGKTKEELFSNMVMGMIAGLRPEIRSTKSHAYRQAGEIRKIKIKSLDLSSLLVDFLSEVLYLIQTNQEIYHKVEFSRLTDTEIEAGLFGQKVEKFGEEIKAVTHHGLEIRQTEDKNWETIVLFDI